MQYYGPRRVRHIGSTFLVVYFILLLPHDLRAFLPGRSDGSRDLTVNHQAGAPLLELGAALGGRLALGETPDLSSPTRTRSILHTLRLASMCVIADAGSQTKRPHNSSGHLRTGWESTIRGIAPTASLYEIRLRSLEEHGDTRQDQLILEQWPTTHRQDNDQVVAEYARLQGDLLSQDWEKGSLNAAIEQYKLALLHWRNAGARASQAITLLRLGELEEILSRNRDALSYYRQSRALSRIIGDCHAEVDALNALASLYYQLSQGWKASSYARSALSTSQSCRYQRGEAYALANLGSIHHLFSEHNEALGNLSRSLELAQVANDRYVSAKSLTLLGYVYSDLGDLQRAFDYLQQALVIWREIGDLRREADTLRDLGTKYLQFGEAQRAIEQHTEAMNIYERMGNVAGQAVAADEMGFDYESIGEPQMALLLYKQCRPLAQAVGDQELELAVLGDLARMYRALGEENAAFTYSRSALALSRIIGDPRLLSYSLTNLGLTYELLGNDAAALHRYEQALRESRIAQDPVGQARALGSIASLRARHGDPETAIRLYGEALSQCQTLDNKQLESDILFNLARIEAQRGNLIAARARVATALDFAESVRTKIGSPELQASFFATVHEYYELYIDILMRLHVQHPEQGLDVLAFQASEQGRARSLLELLRQGRPDVGLGVEPALLEQENSLRQMLEDKAHKELQLGKRHSQRERAVLAAEVGRLSLQYESLQSKIREKNPKYAGLTRPKPLTLPETQQLLGDDDLLLEYSLGEHRSYLWSVTRTTFHAYDLPGRARIETAARRVRALLVEQKPVARESLRQHGNVSKADDPNAWEPLGLGQMLLGQVAEEMPNRRLLIVSDGILHYFPFAVLPMAGQDASEYVPLVAGHEIVNLPSASAVAALRIEVMGRVHSQNSVAVLADPVFEMDDPRIALAYRRLPPQKVKTIGAELHLALRDVGLLELSSGIPRLPATRQEAEAIISLAPPGTAVQAVDFQASMATATSSEIATYRIVHFATHGLLDAERPGLSGIILSLVDEHGRSQNGYLRVHDIYNLKLSADLVVLSACNSGLGKEIRGEGLVGLVRGFMYAGAARVVATLWKVDDEATSEFMKRFYRAILAEGKSPAAALREAQLEMWRQKRWHSPYYWAAFVMQGEWR